MKKLFQLILILVFAVSLVACGAEKEEPKSSESAVESVSDSTEKEVPEEKPSGIHEDGMGEDPDFGEGIGEVVSLSDEEMAYMQAQTTNSWLEMTALEKSDLVVLVGRWLEEHQDYIVADYDELMAMLDHQMEQYYRNGVDEGVFDTACDILGIA